MRVLPGQEVATYTHAVYHNASAYEDPQAFDGFRYARARKLNEEGAAFSDVDGAKALVLYVWRRKTRVVSQPCTGLAASLDSVIYVQKLALI